MKSEEERKQQVFRILKSEEKEKQQVFRILNNEEKEKTTSVQDSVINPLPNTALQSPNPATCSMPLLTTHDIAHDPRLLELVKHKEILCSNLYKRYST